MHLANGAGNFRRGNAVAAPPARYRISLGHRVDDHRAAAHALDLSHRDMRDLSSCAWVKNVLVDRISEAERIKLAGQAGDEFHFVAGENLAGGIVRIAD